MASLFLAKRTTINLSKALSKDHPRHVASANRLFRACFYTAFERAQGSSAAAETRREGNGPDGTPGTSYSATNDPTRQGLYEAKQQALDPNNNHHNEDDKNNNVEDLVVVEVHKIDGPVDTVEYRNIDGNIDDLRRIGGGAD